jgi:hypothetical protein
VVRWVFVRSLKGGLDEAMFVWGGEFFLFICRGFCAVCLELDCCDLKSWVSFFERSI